MRRFSVRVIALLPLLLAGCTSLVNTGSAEIAGITGAALASAVTHNAGVAAGIGLGAQAGARAGLQYAQRKELLFSAVESEEEKVTRSWFTTTACEGDRAWQWAAAEPAVDRWVNLQ